MFEAVGGALTKVLHDDCENWLSWVRIPVPTHRSLLAKLIVGVFFRVFWFSFKSGHVLCACLFVCGLCVRKESHSSRLTGIDDL